MIPEYWPEPDDEESLEVTPESEPLEKKATMPGGLQVVLIDEATNYDRLQAKWAFNNHELAQRLKELDQPKIIAALRWLDVHLKSGEWVTLRWPPRREKSRKLNRAWRRSLKTAMRLLRLKSLRAKDEHGRNALKLYLARDLWSVVRLSLGWGPLPGPEREPLADEPLPGHLWQLVNSPAISAQQPPEPANKRAERLERERQEEEFDRLLFSAGVEHKFKRLPIGFKVTVPQLQELANLLGPLFLERTRTYLCRHFDPQTQRLLASERRRLEAETAAEVKPQPKEPTMASAVKSWLRSQQARW